jgi:hypothetical protein
MGYSQFRNLIVTSPAPVFLDIDGQGTANNMTPIHFDDRCIIRSVATPMTFIKFADESCEGINIQNCTFIQSGVELVIFDSTASPLSSVTDYLTFENNEVDADTADDAAWRFFKFTNVNNIAFNQNTLNCGGTKTYVADLVDSNVSSCYGNSYKSLVTALFNADATSTVKAGYQAAHGLFVQRPVFTTTTAGIYTPTYGATVSLDGRVMDAGKHEIVVVGVTNNAGYTISVDTSLPQFMTIGQVFTVVIQNISGGAISAGTFNPSFSLSGATVAPANGFNRSYTFYFNGTKAIEISRGAGDVAN